MQKFYYIKGQKRLNPELEQREVDKKLAQKEDFERQITEYKEIIEKMKVSLLRVEIIFAIVSLFIMLSALDYLASEQKRVEDLAKESEEKRSSLNNRLQDLLIGISEIFK